MDLEKLAQVLLYFLEYPQDLKEAVDFQKNIYKSIDTSLKKAVLPVKKAVTTAV